LRQLHIALMLRYLVTYIATLLAFAALDSAWIGLFAAPLYRQTLGPMMLDSVRIPPSILFYILQIAGIMVFVVPAASARQTAAQNFLYGALFGLFTYATFDLTNYAIVRPWSLYLTVTDIAWGCFVTGAAACIGIALGTAAARRFS
jgi:uncharacterized membrane protein